MNEDALNTFWYWIRAREEVRKLKEKYPEGITGGYSNDPILNLYHFCNVRREDDRGTKEIREVVLKYFPYEDTDLATISSLPTVYLMARLFNHAPTVERVLESCDFGLSIEEAFEALKEYRDAGNKIFNPAYVVSTAGESMDKIDYVLRLVLAAQKVIIPTESLAAAHAALSSIPGLGGTGFLAGQVVADLRNDRYLVDAASHQDWCCPGPGSMKGMDFIWPTKTTLKNFNSRIVELYDIMPEDVWFMELHAQDLQNCLCEFSKYMRLSRMTEPQKTFRRRYYKRGGQ